MYRQAWHSNLPWTVHEEHFTDIRTNNDLFANNVAEKECVYSAARTEHSNRMMFNICIPMFIRANVLADRLTLYNEFRFAPLHVRFLDDEMCVRVCVCFCLPLVSPSPYNRHSAIASNL